ncbi:MAG: outer membrane beta-barrel protein [Deltaproteobacteria bacterium]|nr:outer membrane beta-barrel protein [Deltaproteobacteria bacterium]
MKKIMPSESSGLRNQRGQDGLTVLALFFFAVCGASLATAKRADAAVGRHGLGVNIGQVLLMGDFSKNFSDSLGWGFSYSYEASDMFGLLANLSFSNHSNANGTNTLAIKGLSPDLRVNLAYFDKLVLYAFGGFGLFHVNETVAQTPGSVWTFGLDLGTGFLLELDPHFQFGTSLGFHNVFSKTDPATSTSSNPNGILMGGTYLGIMLNIFYLF